MIKSVFLLATLLSLAVTSPVANPVQTTPALGTCSCKPPICPLGLVTECECKAVAALECYQKKTAGGLNCLYPIPTICNDVRRAETTAEVIPVPTAKPSLVARKCACKAPICPLELIAECKCKNAAALECYESHLSEGIQCSYPLLTNCGLVRRVDTTTTYTPTRSVQSPPVLGNCSCKPPVCPLELTTECRCKSAAAQACYKSKVAEGLVCPSPTPLPCDNLFPLN